MNFPSKGEIWTAKTSDGYTRYRVIIQNISPFEGDVHYSPLNTGITHVASEQLFLSLYRKDPDQCLAPPPPGKVSSSKTLWRKVRAFFSV